MHARHRDLDGALAVLRGVKRGMVERVGNDVGLGGALLATVYTGSIDDEELWGRVEQAEDAIKERWAMQVFPVPLAPLELLVSSPATAGLVSDDLLFIANVGLWRVQVFNEYVRMQADSMRDSRSRSATLIRIPDDATRSLVRQRGSRSSFTNTA